jgi:hypothetical protein
MLREAQVPMNAPDKEQIFGGGRPVAGFFQHSNIP